MNVDEISFSHPLLPTQRRLVRGRESTVAIHGASLPWTSATKALTVLALRSAALVRRSSPSSDFSQLKNSLLQAALVGRAGSAARTLDYAISKRPNWVVDLFHFDSEGSSLVGRFFWRVNSEGRRPGPISISFNPHMFSARSIVIRKGGKEITNAEQLLRLAESLEQSAFSPAEVDSTSVHSDPSLDLPRTPSSIDRETFRGLAKQILTEELRLGLHTTNIFSKSAVTLALKSVSASRLFRGEVGRKIECMNTVLEVSSSDIRMGLVPPKSWLSDPFTGLNKQPVRVCISAITIGALALFRFLQLYRDLPLEVSYNFPTGIEIAQGITEKSLPFEPDLCVGATPSMAEIVGKTKGGAYQPVMLLPRHSHRIVAPRLTSQLDGEYIFCSDKPSGSLYYHEVLLQQGIISKNGSKRRNADLAELFSALQAGDSTTRTILWFPLYSVADCLFSSPCVDQNRGQLGQNWIFLLASESFVKRSAALHCLLGELHNAWLTLRDDEALLSQVIDSLTNDDLYIHTLYRACGLHLLEARPLGVAIPQENRISGTL